MSEIKNSEQLPSCQHLEGQPAGKNDFQVIVSEDHQTVIRKKVIECPLFDGQL